MAGDQESKAQQVLVDLAGVRQFVAHDARGMSAHPTEVMDALASVDDLARWVGSLLTRNCMRWPEGMSPMRWPWME